MNDFKILFFGTPDFSLASLKALLEAGEHVVGVVTQPDKKKGRGMKLSASPVKQYALQKGIPVFTPETLKDNAISGLLEDLRPDLIAVVAYGKLFPAYVLTNPPYGCINVHASLLPKYRGAAPIQRAVMDGEKETGVTTMRMEQGLDTGDMLLYEKIGISEDNTAGEIFDKLAVIGGKLLVRTVRYLREGKLLPEKQPEEGATYAAKITPEDCLIDWDRDAREVHNQIRGLSPAPGAYSCLNGKTVKLFDSLLVQTEPPKDAVPGQVISMSDHGIVIRCRSGAIQIRSVKPEGGRLMQVSDFINGRNIAAGDCFSSAEKDAGLSYDSE